MTNRWKQDTTSAPRARDSATSGPVGTPGKRTLTEGVPARAPAGPRRPAADGASQQPAPGARADGAGGPAAPADVGGTQLPGLSRLQGMFGHHDLSSVSYVGGPRGAAVADAMGTTALATGGLVVSGSDDPSVVAHEAAHVVLQRGGVTDGPEAERRADDVAAGVARGQNVQAMLDQVAAPGAANAPMRSVDPMKKGGMPLDISTLSPRAVLMAIDTVSRYGEPSIAGDTEYEVGDTAALQARRTAPGFGATEIHDLAHLLTGGNLAVQAVATSRHLAVTLPQFQHIYQTLSADARVIGLNEWAIMNSVYVEMILHGPPDVAQNGAEQLLDSLNELRMLQTVLAGMGPTDKLDARELAIAGTAQTADGTVMDAADHITKQVEVKTVRAPIQYNQLADVKSQLGAGLTKFAHAGPGDYEVHIFASYSEAPPKTTAMGPFTKTESIDREHHTFERTSTKVGYDQSTRVADELLAYLNGTHRANPTLTVMVFIENTPSGVDRLLFTHPGAGANWV